MTFEWYHWAILGLAMVGSELLIPTLVLVWFGLGALVVALVVALVPDIGLAPELLIWIVVSVALVALWFKVFKPMRHKTLVGRSSAQAVGEVGLLVADVSQFQRGQVRFQAPVIGADVWECVSDEAIKAGSRVKIASVEGTILRVTTTEHQS